MPGLLNLCQGLLVDICIKRFKASQAIFASVPHAGCGSRLGCGHICIKASQWRSYSQIEVLHMSQRPHAAGIKFASVSFQIASSPECKQGVEVRWGLMHATDTIRYPCDIASSEYLLYLLNPDPHDFSMWACRQHYC